MRTTIRPSFTVAALLAIAACSQSNEDQLQEAANQSDPAAAAVLNGAAENGMDPQQALEAAGRAAATTNAPTAPPSAQARPNTAQQPNPAQPGQPPEKVVANQQ
jgi:Tfp pilus assembly protein PilP